MIDRPRPYNSVILVQSPLADLASQALRRQVVELLSRGDNSVLVFFHAAAAALDDDRERRAWAELVTDGQITLAVCQAARARRAGSALDSPFEASSLVRFWDAVQRAESLYGPARCAVRANGYVVRIAHQVDEPEAREYLEMVLAGASLELDLIVLFEGDGLTLLAGERARPWRQLVDHGLARMATTNADPVPLLESVDATTVERWRATRSWIEP